MPPVDPALAARGVSRRFAYRHVLRDVTLEIAKGQVVVLVGPNGAGKTTLLRLFAGLLRPSTGSIERHGSVGMVAHRSMLYDALSARENLTFFARLHGLRQPKPGDELLERLGLHGRADEPIAGFSRGMIQRLALARALVFDPDILLLDEPLSNLDEATSAIVLDVFRSYRDHGRTMVIVTHHFTDVVDLAASIGFLAFGRVLSLEARSGRDAAAVAARYRELIPDG